MILCYSGTGNSRYIAQRIADELQDNILNSLVQNVFGLL